MAIFPLTLGLSYSEPFQLFDPVITLQLVKFAFTGYASVPAFSKSRPFFEILIAMAFWMNY